MSDIIESEDKPMLSNETYDFLKKTVQIILPALGTLYFTLASIWGLPAAEQVVGTIAALTVFGGVLLSLSSKRYNDSDGRFDGSIDIEPGEDEETTNLNVSLDPVAMAYKDEVVVKINRS